MRHIGICPIMFLSLLVTLPAFGADIERGLQGPGATQSIAEMHALGASWFRTGCRGVTERQACIDTVRTAKQQNMKVLLVVGADDDYDDVPADNAGDSFKKLCGWGDGSHKLSRINLAKFADHFRARLDVLKAAGLTIDAFEIGNEPDWICFNGDVPNGHEATQDEFMAVVRGYAHFLKTAAEIIRLPQYYPQAKIITGGLGNISDNVDKPMHHIRDPARIFVQLQNVDGFNYLNNSSYHVDGYGIHLYPFAYEVFAYTQRWLHRDIDILGHGRPIWITEWGLSSSNFPNKSGQTRAQAAGDFYAAIKEFNNVSFGPVFYWAYSGAGGNSLADKNGNPLPDAQAVMQGN